MNNLKCDYCDGDAIVDGKTVHGYWAFMCRLCFQVYGLGIGIGKGTILKKEVSE